MKKNIMTNIEIERETADGLSSENWTFYINDKLIAVINTYTYNHRESKRHGWKTKKRYERIFGRNSNILIRDVPFDDDVINEVRNKIINSIQIRPI